MKITTIFVAIALAGSMALANDAENSSSTTVDHSKNPITGTEKTVKKHHKKKKDKHGEAKTDTTETTKVHKDGTVDTKTETDTSTSK